jgi:hypothetical protein
VPLSAAAGLADVLDLATSTGHLAGTVIAGGAPQPVPDEVARVLGGGPRSWQEHDRLVVAGVDVDWWVNPDGEVHACTIDGLAGGLAWAAGRWERRLDVAAVLANPDRVDELLAQRQLEG